MTHKMPYTSLSNELFFSLAVAIHFSFTKYLFFALCTGLPHPFTPGSSRQEKSLLAAGHSAGEGWLWLCLHQDFARLVFYMRRTRNDRIGDGD